MPVVLTTTASTIPKLASNDPINDRSFTSFMEEEKEHSLWTSPDIGSPKLVANASTATALTATVADPNMALGSSHGAVHVLYDNDNRKNQSAILVAAATAETPAQQQEQLKKKKKYYVQASRRTLPVDEPTSSSAGGGVSSESDHREILVKPLILESSKNDCVSHSNSSELSCNIQDPTTIESLTVSRSKILDLTAIDIDIESVTKSTTSTVITTTTTTTTTATATTETASATVQSTSLTTRPMGVVPKKKRPWRIERVLKQMRSLFLEEQAQRLQQTQEKRERLRQQKAQALKLRRQEEERLMWEMQEKEWHQQKEKEVEEKKKKLEERLLREQEQLQLQQPELENDDVSADVQSLTTSAHCLSEEQQAAKRLLAMRVRDTFLVPRGVSLLAQALTKAGCYVDSELKRPTPLISDPVEDAEPQDGRVTLRLASMKAVVDTMAVNMNLERQQRDIRFEPLTMMSVGNGTAGEVLHAAEAENDFEEWDEEGEEGEEEEEQEVAPKDRVFIFVDNSNILTGFYHYQQKLEASRRGEEEEEEEKEEEEEHEEDTATAAAISTTLVENQSEQDDNTAAQYALDGVDAESSACTTAVTLEQVDTQSREEIVLYPCIAAQPICAKDKTLKAPQVTDIGSKFVDKATSTDEQCRPSKKARHMSTPRMVKGAFPKFDYGTFFRLLRRRRPAARQVLVGSSPLFQELDKAMEHGYETIILRRVRKLVQGELGALPVPVKQPWYPPSSSASTAATTTTLLASIDGGSTTQPVGASEGRKEDSVAASSSAATATMITSTKGEQGVDELLHLKMLETLLDHEPAVMVLATGDGGDSEFGGGGFYAVIKRALDRGWQVEVVSWEDQLSGVYLDLALEYGYTKTTVTTPRTADVSMDAAAGLDERRAAKALRKQKYKKQQQHQQQHQQHRHEQPGHRKQKQSYGGRRSSQSEDEPDELHGGHGHGHAYSYSRPRGGGRGRGHLRVWCLDWYGDRLLLDTSN
ncbi:hypothetical protein EDD11_000615 [Mortierella claussenii]|nr:hypothetical protein EDD11_000615 [Mortierella claussenii]